MFQERYTKGGCSKSIILMVGIYILMVGIYNRVRDICVFYFLFKKIPNAAV